MNKTVLILFAACVGMSLLSLHLVKQMRAEQATVAELQARIAKMESEREQSPPASAQVVTPAPTATWQIEPMTPPSPPPQNKQTPKAPAGQLTPAPPEGIYANGPSREERMRMIREAHERQRQLMQDPDYREAMRVQQRSNMGRQYPGLAQELGLTMEQTDQLFDLLVEQQMRGSEQTEFWDPEALDPASMQQRQEKMQQQWMETQKRNEAELVAQLGPEKLQSWKDYQSTLGARHQAEQLRNTLAGRGVPLGEDASRAVVKAYAEAQKAEMQEYANMARANAGPSSTGRVAMLGTALRGFGTGSSAEMYERHIENTKKRNQRVLDALSPFLTYEQREALQKEQESELKMQEAQMRMMRAQSNVDGNSGGWRSNSVQGIIVPYQ